MGKILNKGEIIVNSDFMKIVVASHYRYRLNYRYTCTEYNFMDICACNGRSLIEIECKISKNDLKNEAKKEKHSYYAGKRKSKYVFVPSRYYIAITRDMYKDKEVIDFINKLNPNYGIIVVENWKEPTFVKEAKWINKEKVSEKIKDSIVARISSENLTLRKKIYDYKISKKNGEEN